MNACDVIALPYRDISTSGAALLAYAFCKPVVASNVGCMSEIVDEKTGILVSPEDVDSLVQGIKEIFSKDYDKMGKIANKKAKEKYSWDKMIDITVEVYQKFIGKK
jgi:glycosyltransferase involved in cell wall biosynthesis